MKSGFSLSLVLVFVALSACAEKPLGPPVGDNNFDDPFDPGTTGQGNSSPEAGDANGRFCVANRDCPATFICAYAVAKACGAAGMCLPYTLVSGCDNDLACGCDGTVVALCAPSGYAPKPVQSTGACPTDSGALDANTDASDGSLDDGSADAASE